MKISELIERLGRTVFEAPFGATAQLMGESPEVAEIRIAVLDEVKKEDPARRRPWRFSLITWCASRSAPRRMRALFSNAIFSAGSSTRSCARACRRKLAGFREILRVEIRADERRGQWLRVEMLAEESRRRPRKLRARKRPPRWWSSAGTANKTEVPLQKARTNIGRLTDVYKSEGLRGATIWRLPKTMLSIAPCRANMPTLFTIRRRGEYRLFNDRWYKRGNKAENNCGLWIVRDGMGQEVHRDTRGTRLLPGDEIHLGKAVVKFQIK